MHRTFVFIHRWSGIIAAVLLIVAGLTGSAITFRGELDRWLNPDLLRVQPRDRQLGMDALVERIEARFPGAVVTAVTPSEDPQDAWSFMLGRKQATAGEGRPAAFSPSNVYVDPGTGEVTGTRERNEFRLDRKNVLGVLFTLHHDLFLGLAGHWILAVAGAVWMTMSLIGIYIAIKQAGGLWRAFRVEGRGSARRLLLELHRSLGLASVIAVVAIALSGIYLSVRQEFTTMVELLSPVSAAPERAWPNRPASGSGVGLERALMEAELTVPGTRAQSASINRAKGFYRVRLAAPGDVNARGDTFAYVSMEEGSILEVRPLMSGSAGDVFLAWQRPLHSGEAFGTAGRLVVLVIGLLPAFLAVTGIYLWAWRRLRQRSASVHGSLVASRSEPRTAAPDPHATRRVAPASTADSQQ